MSLKDFSYGNTTDPTWREAEVKCVGRGAYDRTKDTFWVEKIKLVSAVFEGDVQGRIANLTTTRDVELSADVRRRRVGPAVHVLTPCIGQSEYS